MNSILFDIVDHIATISLNRPQRHNAMTDEMQGALLSAILEAAETNDVRAIVLRGEGKSFCSGRDTSVLGERAPGDSDYTYVQRAQKITHALLDCPKPIIAAVKGAAIGGGLEFALASDMRVFSHSVKAGLPEITYGLLPDMGGTQTLTRMIGRSRTKYLVMTGAIISSAEAFDWGMADWLLPDEEVDAKAADIAATLTQRSPRAVMLAKRLVDQADIGPIKRGLQQELTSISGLFPTDDYAEARAALKDKRPPRFTGK